jgi:hypothetical protein
LPRPVAVGRDRLAIEVRMRQGRDVSDEFWDRPLIAKKSPMFRPGWHTPSGCGREPDYVRPESWVLNRFIAFSGKRVEMVERISPCTKQANAPTVWSRIKSVVVFISRAIAVRSALSSLLPF